MEYKGELKGFPTEVVEKMLERQVEQGNPRNVTVFESVYNTGTILGGFSWMDTPEGQNFWEEVLENQNFELFFEKYPKTKKELTFPREMLVWENPKNKKVELVLGIFPNRLSPYKVIGVCSLYLYAEEIPEKSKDPLFEKLEKLETELQTLKDEIKSRTAGQCKP